MQEKLLPLLPKLKTNWFYLLEDYSILISQHHSNLRSSLDQKYSFKKLKGNLFEYATVNDMDLYQFYNLAWPSVLFASSLVLSIHLPSLLHSNNHDPPIKDEKEGKEEIEEKKVSESSPISNSSSSSSITPDRKSVV